MILYYLDHSPFAARVHLAILAKNLDIELAPPPGGALSDTYRALTPFGLVPALELGDGTVIAESQVILEYLEDRFPEPPLRPSAPEDRARARVLAQVVDLYLAEPLKRLFERSKANAAALGDETESGLSADPAAVQAALDHLDHYLRDRAPTSPYAVGAHLTTADCALVTMLFFVDRGGSQFGPEGPFADRPDLAAYWSDIAEDRNVAEVLKGMTATQDRRARQRAAGRPED